MNLHSFVVLIPLWAMFHHIGLELPIYGNRPGGSGLFLHPIFHWTVDYFLN
jgi:hypothetical protein